MSLENPFIKKPDNLNPNSAEFLQKYAGASNEQLKKAGLSTPTEDTPPLSPKDESTNALKEAASAEEKEAYLNEPVECDGIDIRRKDMLAIQAIGKKINIIKGENGQPEVELGKEVK